MICIRQRPPAHHQSSGGLWLLRLIPGNAFTSLFMCLTWEMLVLISITRQIYDSFHSRNGAHNSAEIAVQLDVAILATSISLKGNA